MDFSIDKPDLIAALDKCVLAVPDAKHPTEAFRVMTVSAKKKSVRFAAVGELCTVDTVAPVNDVKTPGAFVVYPKQLHAFVSHLPPGKVRFTMKGTRVTVQSGKRKSSFENLTIEVSQIDDPGQGAPWVEVRASELVRTLKMVKAASTWDESGKPVNSFLVPSPAGLQVYGCNGYLITLVQSSMQVDGPPIQVPATAVAVLQLMTDDDDKVRILSDGRRFYLENCDTLVSAPLNVDPGMQQHPHMIALIEDEKESLRGPTFDLKLLQDGIKAILSGAGFAGDLDKKGSRGYQIKAHFGQTVRLELALSNADTKDEFDVVDTGADLDFYLGSAFLDQLLKSLSGIERVRAIRNSNLLLLRSQGVIAGIMEERPPSE